METCIIELGFETGLCHNDEIRFTSMNDDVEEIDLNDSDIPSNGYPFFVYFSNIFHLQKYCFEHVWKKALFCYIAHLVILLFYDFVLQSNGKAIVYKFASYFSRHLSTLPLALMLRLFTTTSLKRRFETMRDIQGTNQAILTFTQSLKKDLPDGCATLDRFTRYVLLFWLLTFRLVCPPLHKRYPSLLTIEKTGFLIYAERRILEKHEKLPNGKRTAQLVVYEWLNLMLKELMLKEKFWNFDDYHRNVDTLRTLKKSAANIVKLSKNNTMLSLAQLVTKSLDCYGVLSIFGHQLVERDRFPLIIITYFPSRYAFSFLFYYAWVMLGRIALNPFEDDEQNIDLVKNFREYVIASIRLRKYYGQELQSIFTSEGV